MRPTDLHRPTIDELTRPNPDDPTGRSTMRRVPEVLDCWFESGSMPFAQVHYPFENRDWFEHHYPGDFIVEYNGQTRGWFYTLHVLATALFDRPAFRLRGARDRARRRRAEDVEVAAQLPGRHGGLRAATAPTPCAGSSWRRRSCAAGDLVVTEQGIREGVRQAVLPLWNTWYFLSLYANAGPASRRAAPTPARARPLRAGEDRRAGRRGHVRRWTSTTSPARASGSATFLEVLTNWYVRRSRERFWTGDPDAIDTLHTVLEVTCPGRGAAAAADDGDDLGRGSAGDGRCT